MHVLSDTTSKRNGFIILVTDRIREMQIKLIKNNISDEFDCGLSSFFRSRKTVVTI